MSHKAVPQYIEVNRRYQCKACHSWIYYDEWIGSWWHQSEKNSAKVWNGTAWELAAAA